MNTPLITRYYTEDSKSFNALAAEIHKFNADCVTVFRDGMVIVVRDNDEDNMPTRKIGEFINEHYLKFDTDTDNAVSEDISEVAPMFPYVDPYTLCDMVISLRKVQRTDKSSIEVLKNDKDFYKQMWDVSTDSIIKLKRRVKVLSEMLGELGDN